MANEFVKKTLRLTKEDAKILEEKSLQNGMCEADYLRFLIRQKPNDYPEIRMLTKNLINEVNHIGKNINQIVHHHNYELYSESDRLNLIASMKQIHRAIEEVVKKIGN